MNLRAPGALLLIASVFAAASCGGGSTTSTQSGATSPAAGSTSTTTQQSSNATASSTGHCGAGELRISSGPGGVATGHVNSPFLIRNLSGPRCTLRGFPAVTPLGRAGAPLPVKVKPAGTDFFGTIPDREVALASAGTASFRLVTTNSGQSIAGCPKARQVRIVLPGTSQPQTLPLAGIVCPGTVTVSRVAAGRSAFPGAG